MANDYLKKITLTRSSGEAAEFEIRRCKESDLDAILALQLSIFDRLSDKSIYALVGEEEIHESLLEDYCFATYCNGELIAFTMMIANRISHRNYGTYIGYPEERQAKCVSMEITLVDDRYRGFGLQKQFVKLREEIARSLGATESLVTIAPGNDYSLANLVNSGYEIIETKPLYEGAVRHILSKQL